MELIRTWLNGNQDYAAGINLYFAYGQDPKLKALFKEEFSAFKHKMLLSALEQLLNGQAVDQRPAQASNSVSDEKKFTPKPQPPHKSWPEQKDETIEHLFSNWKPLFAERMNLMSRLADVAEQGYTSKEKKHEAGMMAHRILDLREIINDIYHQRDFYIKYGQLPERPQPLQLVTDPKKYPLALSNCRRYVRDYKNKLKKSPGDPNAFKQLEKYQWAIKQYEKLLGITDAV